MGEQKQGIGQFSVVWGDWAMFFTPETGEKEPAPSYGELSIGINRVSTPRIDTVFLDN
jgi:hypothetical protein